MVDLRAGEGYGIAAPIVTDFRELCGVKHLNFGNSLRLPPMGDGYPSRGTVTVIVVPAPGADSTDSVPPTRSARSAIDSIP